MTPRSCLWTNRANDVQSQPVTIGVRPEHTDVSEEGIRAHVEVAEMMGNSVHLHVNFSFKGNVVHVFSKKNDKNLEF